MARTPSVMVPLGSIAPDFELNDVVSNSMVSLSSLNTQSGLLVLFICNHCPFVHHIQDKLVEIANNALSDGLAVVAISSNDVSNYPDDSPENMKKVAKSLGFNFPYLYDHDQSVAKAFDAACTPDLFLFDKHLGCVYRGQFDDSRPGNNIPVTGTDLSNAIHALLTNSPIPPDQKPSLGCNIKWIEQ